MGKLISAKLNADNVILYANNNITYNLSGSPDWEFYNYRNITLDIFLREQGLLQQLLNSLEALDNYKEVDVNNYLIESPLKDSNIICVGRNYAAHARELGNPVPDQPVLFMKSNSALTATGTDIIIPENSIRVEHEGELVLVIGQDLMGHIDQETARSAIAGLTLMNDVTDRGMQSKLKEKGKPWLPAKSRPTFAPCGDGIQILSPDANINEYTIRTTVNGELRQEGKPSHWLWTAANLVSTIAASIGLRAGDMIATGTPAGVGELKHGDEVVISCEEIGVLTNKVIDLRVS